MGFQNDARRKEREMKRNNRMTKTLSSISVIFAVSWLPYHTYLILTDIFIFVVSIFEPCIKVYTTYIVIRNDE